jgi:hypothetical protein
MFEGVGGSRVLTVLVGPEESDDTCRWKWLHERLCRALSLELQVRPSEGFSQGASSQLLLEEAATIGGPVLVSPRSPLPRAVARPHEGEPVRILIASDASREVARGARGLYERLSRGGFPTSVVLVLTHGSLPRIWEGPGYQAAAWRTEVRQRHGRPECFKVVTGDPSVEVRRHAADCDLLVLMWRGAVGAGHAQVVRAVLEDGVQVPCLLVPLEWVTTSGLSEEHRRMWIRHSKRTA